MMAAHGGSEMDAAAAASGTPDRAGRNYHRPGLRAPSPTMQKRLEAMHHSHNNNNSMQSSHQPSPRRYGARTPTLEAMSPGNSGMNSNATPPPPPPGPSSTGLIRITLKKPMGIVFEPMEDPHNPSQQRGVRICDLPRTGAAAMSGQLKVRDELLSINDKTMSRLTFDEIMDFIIAADAEQIKLLFRRPKKEKGGKRGEMEKSTSVKWMDVGNDDKNKKRGKKKKVFPKEDHYSEDDDNTMGEETMGEETMGDDTFYTEETEETRRRRTNRSGRKNRRYRNESFLDMLIDSICAPMMGDMGKKRREDDYSDDGTFNSAEDDSTYATFESYERRKNKRGGGKNDKQSSKKESKKRDESPRASRKNGGRNRSPPPPPRDSEDDPEQQFEDENDDMPIGHSRSDTFDGNLNQDSMHSAVESRLNSKSRETQESPSAFGLNPPPSEDTELRPQSRFEPQINHVPDEPEEMLETDPNIPISELEYDDRDHGADVSVMESVGGPSLLLENMRMKEAMKASRRQVSPEIIEYYGLEFPVELGLTREETIRLNPDKFYRYVVKDFLTAYEPEKVRLLDKLFTKYKGREEHLIQKLNSRYGDDHKTKIDDKSAGLQEPIQEEPQQDEGFQQFGNFPQENSREESKNDIRGDFHSGSIDDNTNSQDGPMQIGNNHRNHHQEDKNAFNQGWLEDDEEVEEGDNDSDTYGRSAGSHVDARDENDAGSHSSYTDSEYDSVDGTSPAVIAQVSELLNYVYGKTSVTGQIDRVSTIMRAYEGREGVLLELLETKAVIKAEQENENAENLPERLRKNPALQNNGQVEVKGQEMMSPVSNMTGSMFDNTTTSGSVEQSMVSSRQDQVN